MGTVKTRLARRVGAAAACDLHRCFTMDILDTLSRVGHPVQVCCHPPSATEDVDRWLGPGYGCRPQQGKDLGERMARAFTEVFSAGLPAAILMGTDFPDLPEAIVHEAFDRLHRFEAVVGPTMDGGYYLIGFRKETFHPEVFEDVPWGSSAVFRRTMGAFSCGSSRVHVLPQWRDIDVYEDLEFFMQNREESASKAVHTRRYLAAAKWVTGQRDSAPPIGFPRKIY